MSARLYEMNDGYTIILKLLTWWRS